jgi:hypothetical protein
MGTFKKGLFLGGLLGAGITWLNTTVQGKKTRDQIIEHGTTVYETLSAELKSSKGWKQLKKSEYIERAQAFIDTYAVETGLSESVKRLVQSLVVSQWPRFKKEQATKSK